MARRKAAPKRRILPDPLFGNLLIAQFINAVMKHGKKSIAEAIVYDALEKLLQNAKPSAKAAPKEGESAEPKTAKGGSIRDSETARKRALELFEEALDKVKPTVEVKSRRVGGSTYQVPVEVRPERRVTLGMRWLIEFASKRGEKSMFLRLANEMAEAIEERGAAVKKREDVHRMAKANQVFAHFRW